MLKAHFQCLMLINRTPPSILWWYEMVPTMYTDTDIAHMRVLFEATCKAAHAHSMGLTTSRVEH